MKASANDSVLKPLEIESSDFLNEFNGELSLPGLKCVNNVPRMCGERALCQECVDNVYLHDNHIFRFFLQLHFQFHPFPTLSEPGNIPGLDSMVSRTAWFWVLGRVGTALCF